MRVVLPFVRVWLPVMVVLAGIVLFAIDPGENAEGAAGIVGAGLSIWLLNLFFRIGVQGDRDREAEDAARAFFDEHGHWPDQAPPPGAPPPPREDEDEEPSRPHRPEHRHRPPSHRPPHRRRPG